MDDRKCHNTDATSEKIAAEEKRKESTGSTMSGRYQEPTGGFWGYFPPSLGGVVGCSLTPPPEHDRASYQDVAAASDSRLPTRPPQLRRIRASLRRAMGVEIGHV